MRILLIFLAAAGIFWLADAPENVRYTLNAPVEVDKRLMLDAPVCLGNTAIRLGQSPEMLKSQGIEAEVLEEEGSRLRLRWKMHDAFLAVDTLVTCTFEGGRLMAVEALSKWERQTTSKHEMLEHLKSAIPCIAEVQNVLEAGSNLSYTEEELGIRQELELYKSSEFYTGIRYRIAYCGAA